MPFFETAVEIKADPAKVWEVFTDFEDYKNWNPFFLDMGALENTILQKGICFWETIMMPPGVKGYFPMKVTDLELQNTLEITMSMSALNPFILDSHRFTLEETSQGTKFIHRYDYSGAIFKAALRVPSILKKTEEIHNEMNEALKRKAS